MRTSTRSPSAGNAARPRSNTRRPKAPTGGAEHLGLALRWRRHAPSLLRADLLTAEKPANGTGAAALSEHDQRRETAAVRPPAPRTILQPAGTGPRRRA